MSNEDYSCIEDIEKVVSITLPFSYAGRVRAGIKATFENWTKQYVPDFQGILIKYKDVYLIESLGRILAEQPFLHYKVKAMFSVFKPCRGCILKGVINKITQKHVGCIVNQFINACIKLPADRGEINKGLILDYDILFQVTNVDTQRRIMQVKGEISAEAIELMERTLPHWSRNKHRYFNDTGSARQEDSNSTVSPMHSPSVEHLQDHELSSDDNTSGFESLHPEDTPRPTTTKKHAKKRKHKEVENESLVSSFPDFGSSRIVSSTPFEIPPKKLKLDTPVSATSFLDYNFATSMNSNCLQKDKKKDKASHITNDSMVFEDRRDGFKNVTIPLLEMPEMSSIGENSISKAHENSKSKKKEKISKKKSEGKKMKSCSKSSKDKKSHKGDSSRTKDKLSKPKKHKKKSKEELSLDAVKKESPSSSKLHTSSKDKTKDQKKHSKDKKHKKQKAMTESSVHKSSDVKPKIKEEI